MVCKSGKVKHPKNTLHPAHRSPLRTLEERCGKNEVLHRSPNLFSSQLGEPNPAIFFRTFPVSYPCRLVNNEVHFNPLKGMLISPWIALKSSNCHPCPVRHRCTKSKHGSRTLDILPRPQHEVLQKARQEQKTAEFWKKYAKRSGIEGTLSLRSPSF